jgi:hypothetical protein
MRIFRGAAFLLLLLATVKGQADRSEFIATLDGQRLKKSRVCFFPAVADDPFFQRFLSSSDVRCLDADSVIAMPAGHWNVFLTHAAGYTGTYPVIHPGTSGTAAGPAAGSAHEIAMQPAATLRFPDVPEGTPVVYIPNGEAGQPATIRPPLPGTRELLVPAAPVLPLLVDGTRIVRIGEVVAPAHRETIASTFPATAAGHRDLVALLRLPFDERDKALDPLEIHLEIDSRRYRPVIPPRAGRAVDASLLLFHDVPNQQATIVIDGPRWKRQRIPVRPAAEAVQTLASPIWLERAAEVTATWQYPFTSPLVPCRGSVRDPAEHKAVLAFEVCADGSCRKLEERPVTLDADSGTSTFTEVAPGEYRITLRDPRFGAISGTTTVRRGETATVSLEMDPVTVSGTVRLGDRPLQADISFVTGRAATDMNGTYVASLPKAPGLETVTIVPCDGSADYTAIPKEALRDGSIFDIRIPDNELRVHVRQAITGASLAGAAVHAAVLFARDDVERFYLDAERTDVAGKSFLRRVPVDAWVRVCASHQGFKPRCSEPFTVDVNEHKELVLVLTPERARTGRLLTDAPIFNGHLYWVRPDGTIAERRVVAEDGTYTYELPHAPPEYMVFISGSLPLTVLPITPQTEIPLPPGPVRDVRITPRDVANARLALEVDGRLVPQGVLGQHQLFRNLPGAIHDGAAVTLPDIIGRQLVVLAGPPTSYLPPGTPAGTDSSTIPHFHALFRRIPVTGPEVEIHP